MLRNRQSEPLTPLGSAAVFGVAAGSVAAWLIVTRLMTLGFVWQAGSAAGVVAAAA